MRERIYFRVGVENRFTVGGITMHWFRRSVWLGNPELSCWIKTNWEKSEDVFRSLTYPQGYFLSQLLCSLTGTDRPPGRWFWLLARARIELWSWHCVHMLDCACVREVQQQCRHILRHAALWAVFLKKKKHSIKNGWLADDSIKLQCADLNSIK